MFRAAIKSPVTLDVYERRLLNFLNDIKMNPNEFLILARNDPISAEKKIIEFASRLKEKANKGEISAGTVGNCLKSVRLLLEMNDVFVNWKKVRRTLPRARRYALDRIPTTEEVREIIEAADIRGKALTLVLLTSGIREGAIESLKIRDYSIIRDKDNRDGQAIAGRLIIYAGDAEQYIAFITLEASNALEKYLEFRRDHGEDITGSAPLFRDVFDPVLGLIRNSNYGDKSRSSENIRIGQYHNKENYRRHHTNSDGVRGMTAHSIRQYYNRLLRSIGIRKERKRRHEFSVHGFRKYFKTKAEIAGMKPINVEILMGHSTGISDSYYRPSESELLADYLKVTDLLTISEEKQLEQKVEKLKIENAEIGIVKRSYVDIKIELEKRNQQIDELYKVLYAQGIIKKQEGVFVAGGSG